MRVYPLQRSSAGWLCAAEPHPDWQVARQSVAATEDTLPSLLEAMQQVHYFPQAQGRRIRLSTVLAICVLARLVGKVGGDATSRYAQSMPQEHLAALDARRERLSGRNLPPSRETIHRVIMLADHDEVQAVANRSVQAHPIPDHAALVADGERINGVNRNGDVNHETATPVTPAQGIPVACRMCPEGDGEHAAVLEDVDLRGAVVTVDALHTSRKTADAIMRTHGADYLFHGQGQRSRDPQDLREINGTQDT